jgi:hypothetical protein
MPKRVIRIIMGYGYRESCRELLKELKLTHSSQYIVSLLLFVVNNYSNYLCSLILTLILLRGEYGEL